MKLQEYENSTIEYKSLKKIVGKSNIKELAKTCVCLANAQGGYLFIGIRGMTYELNQSYLNGGQANFQGGQVGGQANFQGG